MVVRLLRRDLDELAITARELELLEPVDPCNLINQTLGGPLVRALRARRAYCSLITNVLSTCVQVGQTTLKGRPDKRNLRPPHQISPSLSHFDLTFYATFHHISIKNLFKTNLKYNGFHFKELCKLSVTHFKPILTV